MPLLESQIITIIAGIATTLTQLLKGLVDEAYKKWIPLVLAVVCTAVGVGLAFYYGRDPVAGALEGFFAFAGAVGFYELASVVPGANSAFNDRGWIAKKD